MHEVDLGVVDQVGGDLRGPVGVGLAVDHLDVERVLLAVTQDEAVTDRVSPLADAEVAGQPEGREYSGERVDETDLDLAAHFGAGADVVVLAAAVVAVVAGAAVVVVAAAVVVVVSSSPQAASRPPRPAPTPMVAPATPAIFRNSRRLTLLLLVDHLHPCPLA